MNNVRSSVRNELNSKTSAVNSCHEVMSCNIGEKVVEIIFVDQCTVLIVLFVFSGTKIFRITREALVRDELKSAVNSCLRSNELQYRRKSCRNYFCGLVHCIDYFICLQTKS